MGSGARFPFAAVILGLLLARATPARGQSEPTTGEPDPEVSTPGALEPTREPEVVVPTPAGATWDPEPSLPIDMRVVRRPRAGFVAAGATTFGVSYGVALLTGLALGALECSDCDLAAVRMSVPVAGPLLLWSSEPPRSQVSVMWPLLWGGIEAVGATMLIIGIVGRDVVEQRVPNGWRRVNLVPSFTPERGALSLNVSW